MKKKVIVIGAGIAGTSAAAALAGCCDVMVLEQETHPGYHATGRSAATWAPFYGPDIIQQLTALSLPLLSHPNRSFSEAPFTSPKGELMLGRKEDQLEIEKHLALGMQSLTVEQAMKIVPLINADAVDSILYSDNMLDIDVNALHQAYIKHLKRNDGKLICNAKVESLVHKNRQWQVTTKETTWNCDVVINAAGAWADHIARIGGVTPLDIQPKRRTAAMVPYLDEFNMSRWPMVFGAAENFYCTPFGNGLMVSPADETPVEPHDAWPDDLDVARGIEEFQNYINYEVTRVDHRWAGLRTFTRDGEPAVGFAADAEGFFWLAGQGGYGIQTSPAIAAICHHLIAGDTSTQSSLSEINIQHIERLNPARLT
ncbi:MAG: FAD-binding oxidoreductase [Granulosicoccus sp.]|nr:FAD-binding oxidoreductase [Granulosicoccus sp.]